MKSDTVEFWNDVWATMDHTFAGPDQLLAEQIQGLNPGRALDLGCGSGGNAVWLAGRGWQVTAVDFSSVAIGKAKLRAADNQVEVKFIVSDVTAYRPGELYDLIICFYIQLWPELRARMLSRIAKALAPGGRFLFVSHDQSSPPSGWSREDLASLTTPSEVAAELLGLRIERAAVVTERGAHAGHTPDSGAPEEHDSRGSEHGSHEEPEPGAPSRGATTVVMGIKDN